MWCWFSDKELILQVFFWRTDVDLVCDAEFFFYEKFYDYSYAHRYFEV